jgi:hypothetical protein
MALIIVSANETAEGTTDIYGWERIKTDLSVTISVHQ